MKWSSAVDMVIRARRELAQSRGEKIVEFGLAADGELVISPLMDARFREACAVYGSGRVLIGEGYGADIWLRRQLLLLKQKKIIPQALIEEHASAEEIAGVWRSAVSAGDSQAAVSSIKRLLEEAAGARASDIVFELGTDECRVYGIANDRKLPLSETLSHAEGREVMGFMFHNKDEGSSQTSYQRNSFQGFSIRAGGAVPFPEGVSGLRCQRGPHEPDGDHLFGRLFYADQLDEGMTLEKLGFSDAEAAVFAELRMTLHGGIFLGGTTGDGKTTTLATNLALQMAEMGGQLNLVTLEDPVEYRIPGAVQIAVPTTGSGEARAAHFKEALMHFCRVHPASGMVSEIRDADAAREVLQFIDTGHQVWTTIHVHSANAILFRLLDMGVSPAEVCKPGNVVLLMKQTLLPRLCGECALDEPAGGKVVPDWLSARLRGFTRVRFRNAEGCGLCRREGAMAGAAWNGYTEQQALSEMIRPDAGYLKLVRAVDPIGAEAYWRDELGGVRIGSKIWGLVASGWADPFDALAKGARVDEDTAVALKVVEGGSE